jgi:L-ribulokinase
MVKVAGVDFGTLSVRVSLFDKVRGLMGTASAPYPLHRTSADPDQATQSHFDQMAAMKLAMREALRVSGVAGTEIRSIAIDATGSSVIMLDANFLPLTEYYLWCDHRAWREAAELTRVAHAVNLEAIRWCGGTYSSEWGWSKLLHWLRHNPQLRPRLATAMENCDMVTATLCGVRSLDQLRRSVCAMGHKWMWGERWGGLPPEEYLEEVDPLLSGMRDKMAGEYLTSDHCAGRLCAEWAEELGLSEGIPLPVGALDAHWDAVGAHIRLGDVVNVIGTSTCIMATTESDALIPGVAGIVPGSVNPSNIGIEAGLSAVGDIFDAIATRAKTPLNVLAEEIRDYRAGQTGLLRLTWDNGDRTVLSNPELGGVTFGWNLLHSAADELFATIEGTAFHTRIVLERMQDYGAKIERVINGGGIPQRNRQLNQIYANVLNKPVLVPRSNTTSLGSAIFAFVAAGAFDSVREAQKVLCSPFDEFLPEVGEAKIYQELYTLFRRAYFALGLEGEYVNLAEVLPALRRIAAEHRKHKLTTAIQASIG